MYTATFSIKGKTIHTEVMEDYQLPLKNTNFEIGEIYYFIEGFVILGNRVIYNVQIVD